MDCSISSPLPRRPDRGDFSIISGVASRIDRNMHHLQIFVPVPASIRHIPLLPKDVISSGPFLVLALNAFGSAYTP
jgi:hypothetical protein